jgi:GAF domain-containing protein
MLINLNDKTAVYENLVSRLLEYTAEEKEMLPILANASALLYEELPEINWAGFYLLREEGELILGPFQGKAAHMRIRIGEGVCGTAVAEEAMQIVPDVHSFEGHIACDCTSNAEIVIPIHRDGKIYGVLDIDSPKKGRFDEEDGRCLQEFVNVLEAVGSEELRGPVVDTWAADAQDDLELWIEEQGIQLRY